MIDRDLLAYVETLPPQDRRTVEQALQGLRSVLSLKQPKADWAEGRDCITLLLSAVRRTARTVRAAH